MKRKTKRNICTVHGAIIALAETIIDAVEGKVPKAIIAKLNKIQELGSEACEYGQSMEQRMSEYRNAIEDLGFKRTH